MLNIGFLGGEGLKTEQLNLIQRILTQRVEQAQNLLFEIALSEDPIVNQYVKCYYNRLVAEKRIDILQDKPKKKPYAKGKDLEIIDLNSIRNKDVREIGAEWMSYQATEQLQLSTFLERQGWSDQDICLAQTHIISRAVYPASEFETSRWIKDNSAVCEVTGIDIDKITKDKLYSIAKKLYGVKDELEQHLSLRTNELFDIEDKIVLFDLTNTYFEGRKIGSDLAKFGRSKEKRSDAKLVVLALVINPQGFIKYSSILEGNMSDPKTLEGMINKLRVKTSDSAQKALVVIDAGIATEDNLKMIRNKGYDYMCVSRSTLKQYSKQADAPTVTVSDNKKQRIDLCRVKSERNTDYYLKVESHAKVMKESSMNEQFRERFEQELQKIADSLTKKSGVKQLDKVHERIGRAKQKYPSIARYFDIEIESKPYVQEKVGRKNKGQDKNKTQDNPYNQAVEINKPQNATAIKWSIKPDVDINARSGVYFLRTTLESDDEELLWQSYNIIREIEATFRVLKTDLDLRPIYHKKDENTMAHLHLGILAYWVVNTIRFQLKQKGINSGWREIVRIMNTQKAVSTLAQNDKDQVIQIRRCTEPNQKVQTLYDALKYKHAPFKKKKSVVHKSELEDLQTTEQLDFWTD
jgi:hypothetical protein